MENVKSVLPASADDKKIEIWWQDEARVGQKGEITYIWAPKGSRPRTPKDLRFGNRYIFGAICPEHNKGAALVLPYANTHAINLHLQEISLHVAKASHAVLLMDQAGWHVTDKLVVPENISILYLPPYSPELNPTENIWEFLKANFLKNRVFETISDIIDACCDAWNPLISEAGRIKSIASRGWAKFA